MFVVLLGPPGAGKGTQARLLARHLGVPVISTGEMFREEIAKDTDLGRELVGYMDEGQLVPDDTTLAVLEARIEQEDARKGAILDGFPRTVTQAESLDEMLEGRDARIDRVVQIDVPVDEIVRRLSRRLTCPRCHATYNTSDVRPRAEGICDRCGSRLIQRADDEPGAIRTRLEAYREWTAPLVGYYRDHGVLTSVDGAQDREAVARELLGAIDGAG